MCSRQRRGWRAGQRKDDDDSEQEDSAAEQITVTGQALQAWPPHLGTAVYFQRPMLRSWQVFSFKSPIGVRVHTGFSRWHV